jgi:hypothetical protein
VRSLGCYDEVITYEELATLPADRPVCFVDMAGDAHLRARLHRHFGDALVYSGRIGLTHQDTSADEADLPGAKPEWFFAPDQIRKRAKEWGPGGIDSRFGAAWSGFAPLLERCITVIESRGRDGVERVYRATLSGRAMPDQGHMLSLWD